MKTTILKVYVDGKLRRTILGDKEVYMAWIRKDSQLDLIIENEKVAEEYITRQTGYVRISLTKEGRIYVVT